MKVRMKLYVKMLLLILTTSFVIFGASILVIGLQIKKNAYNKSVEYADLTAEVNARQIKGEMQKYMSTAQGLNNFLLSFESLDSAARRGNLMNILKYNLKKKTDILSLWTIWEPNTIDNFDSLYINVKGNTYIGNFSPTYYKDGDSIKLEGLSSGPLFQGDYYTIPKANREQTLLAPYYYSYGKGEEYAVLQTNMIVPLIYNGRFLGVIGADASLDSLQKYAEQIKPFDESYAFLIAHDGSIVAHRSSKWVGQKLDTLKYSKVTSEEILQNAQWNNNYNFTDTDPITGQETYFTMSPLTIGKASERWVFGIAVPTSELNSVAKNSFILSIIAGLVALSVLSIFIYIIARSITRPVTNITRVLEEIAKGNIETSLKVKGKYNDEINDMAQSVNKLIDGLNETASFAKQIGEGNLDREHQLLSKNDFLGQSLVDMRESLKEARKFEEEKREKDRKQAWVTQGLAQFGEILREDNDDMQKFSLNIAKHICEYMEIPQCAIFIIEEDENESYFDLKAVHAFGSQKLIDKKVKEGEELVGRAISEKNTIHLTNTPDSFATLTSGKTDDPAPNNLLIVPMLMNDEPFGLLELMGYEPFEYHQIEFAEKLAENIAATVSSVKTNIRTAQLLKQSEQLKDELSQQEEEMRQNLEEMQATQEEAKKRESELSDIRNTLQNTTMMAEYDLDGRIIRINELMANTYGHAAEHMIGKFQDAFVTQDDASRRGFLKFWQEVISGVTKKRIHEVTKRDQTIYLNETYIPIFEDEEIDRVLNIATDITHKVKLDKEITQLMNKVSELKNN
ncbi:MAG TPA: GAF domain-containing protein [Salinivirga sp.]|uniref:GAF domain-containing protein n=1 Tax=Salinivirga sp. TaxID=1970192 RepID=UPI002B46D9E1|nr:GAF domain-containing protein [Salinivirga sp.]HKK58903.1 GAF domain-containing protein [Salinivirga sp.]